MNEYETYVRDMSLRFKAINAKAPDLTSAEHSYERGWITKEEFQATEREAVVFISKKEELTKEYYSKYSPTDKDALGFFSHVKDRLLSYQTKGNEYLKQYPDDPKKQGFNLALTISINKELDAFLNHQKMNSELGWMFWTSLDIYDLDEKIFEL
ncbi:hypothetical protein LPTSP3_g04630 [Leptospira kobayashii]|uniref:Uncharacterized protein n=1 Tax=Leptospira kobayashii TaxID=1917830 RepID=A0ABN6K9A8_9LEPT|nr:hypothetical protein [Leptospira kobayashii]BDA77533.1 hypothetical protein LPTSP3_g04630 [Leptospira kobayashii]